MTEEERKEKMRQYSKEAYYWQKSKGICVCCGQDYSCAGSVFCPECLEKVNDRSRAYHAAHLEEHKEYCRKNSKRLYNERKAAGLCIRCGHKAANGKTRCTSCSIKRRKNNGFDRSMRSEFGMCYICGKPLNKWESLCDDCHNSRAERMRKLNENPTPAMLKSREEYRQYMDVFFPEKKKKGAENKNG